MSSSDSKIIDDDKNNNKDKDTNNNDNDDNNSSDSDLEEAHRLLSEQEARDRELALALSQGKRRSGRSRRAVVPTGSTAAAVTQSRDQVLLASVTNAFNGYGQGEHLRDIPHVRESLEQARDDAQWIKLLYYYTFERGELAEMPSGAVRKARLLAFNGFEDQSPERVERFRNFMAQQSSEVLETIRANLDLSVDVPKRTKAAVATAIAEFMAEPEEPEDKPKPKARKRSRASASGAKKGKGKSKGKSKKKQKKKASKASGAGRTNAYMMFCKEQRPLMKDSHPDATFGELNKLIGAKWHSLTDEGKAEYTNRAAVENERREAGGGAAAPKTSGTKRKRATKAKSKAKAKKKVKKETTDDDGDVEMAAPSQPKAKKSKAKKPAADDSKQKRIISALINDLLSRSDLGSLSQKGVRKHIAEQLGKDVAKSYKAFIKEHTAKRVKQMIV